MIAPELYKNMAFGLVALFYRKDKKFLQPTYLHIVVVARNLFLDSFEKAVVL